MLELKALTKYYNTILGCKDISLKVDKGEIFGFIGPNGAGKSTAIRCIMNMINITSGGVYIQGEYIDDSDFKMKEEIGYLPSEIHLYDDLTVKAMLEYNASFYRKNCTKKTKELVKLLDIDTTKKVDELSFGNSKKLGIILALMHDPTLIILDEPTNGLDPLMQEVFYEIILNEKKNGKTIFFSSHNLSEIKRLCNRVAIIKDGNIVAIDEPNKLGNSNFNIVSINSKEIAKLKNKITGKIIEEKDNFVKLIYQKDIQELIKILGSIKIDKLLIEEPSIEEIFMHYYV